MQRLCYTKEKEERKPRQFFRYHVLPPKKKKSEETDVKLSSIRKLSLS